MQACLFSLLKRLVNFVDIATARQYPNKFDIALSQIAMLLLLLFALHRQRDWPHAHTTCGCDCCQGCCDSGHNDLQDQFPDVLVFHDILFYRFNNSFAAAIVSSDIKRRLSTTAIAFMSAGHSFSVSLSFPPKLVSLHTAAM